MLIFFIHHHQEVIHSTTIINGTTIRGKTPTTSAELATLLLEEVEVAAVPGEAFGPSGYLRFSYATSDADIIEGIGRIKKLITEG